MEECFGFLTLDSKKVSGLGNSNEYTPNLYAVEIQIKGENFYLVDLKGTISQCVSNSIIFVDYNKAAFYATKVEEIYKKGVLGRVRTVDWKDLF